MQNLLTQTEVSSTKAWSTRLPATARSRIDARDVAAVAAVTLAKPDAGKTPSSPAGAVLPPSDGDHQQYD
jgi:hypothetical protein